MPALFPSRRARTLRGASVCIRLCCAAAARLDHAPTACCHDAVSSLRYGIDASSAPRGRPAPRATRAALTDVHRVSQAPLWRRSLTWKSKLLLIIAIVQFLALLALTIERLATIPFPLGDEGTRRVDFIYGIVLLMNMCTRLRRWRMCAIGRCSANAAAAAVSRAAFTMYYIVHGVLFELRIEVYVYIVASVLVGFYVIYQARRRRAAAAGACASGALMCLYAAAPRNEQYAGSNVGYGENWELVRLIRMIVVLVTCPPGIVLAVIVSNNFGFLRFNIIGADVQHQCRWPTHRAAPRSLRDRRRAGLPAAIFRTYSLFLGLLKLDFQVALSLCLLAALSKYLSSVEIGIAITGILLTIPFLVIAWSAIRYENKKLMIVFLVFSLLQPAYVIYVCVEVQNIISLSYMTPPIFLLGALMGGHAPVRGDPPAHVAPPTPRCAAPAGVLSLVLRMAVLAFAILAYRNFGLGLKDRSAYAPAITACARAPPTHDAAWPPVDVQKETYGEIAPLLG